MKFTLRNLSSALGILNPVKTGLPVSFWLLMAFFAFLLWVTSSYLIYHEQSRIAKSADLSVKTFSSFISSYVEKHKTLAKTLAMHHQEKIINLAEDRGYLSDIEILNDEIAQLFPEGTGFIIFDRDGNVKIGSEIDQISAEYEAFIKNSVKRLPASSPVVKAHPFSHGDAHFDILHPVRNSHDMAGIWIKVSLGQLNDYLVNYSSEEFSINLAEQLPPYTPLLGRFSAVENRELEFGFLSEGKHQNHASIERAISVHPIKDISWQVYAMPLESDGLTFQDKIQIGVGALYIVTFFLIGIMLFISNLLQREKEKAKQDAEHDVLFNSGPTVLLEKTPQRNMLIKYASPNSGVLFNHEPIELLEQSYLNLIYPDDIDLVREKLLLAYHQMETNVELFYRIQSLKNGGFIWIYDFTNISYSNSGEPLSLRGYITSIHDQKMAEKNAKDLIQSVPEAIFVTQLDGAIVSFNQAAQSLFKLTDSFSDFINFMGLFKEESRGSYLEAKKRFLAGKTERATEEDGTFKMISDDGYEILAEINFNQIEINESSLLIQVVRDVTIQTQARKQLEKSKKEAEALAKARSRFVATMSHEIRTPMNGVLGMTDLLLETHLSSKQNRYLKAIKSSGNSLLELINEVLDFAKLDEGRVELVEQRLDLKELIDEVAYVLSTKAKDKDLDLRVNYDIDAPRLFLGDEVRLKQVMLNLLGNAIKFTDHGYVRITAKPILDLTQQYQMMQIEIQDTGIGIEKQNQTRLFKAFSQAESETARKFGGTGLGLAISRQLIELMQGQVGVESEVDQGSTFWVRIPLKPLSDIQLEEGLIDSVQSIEDKASDSRPKKLAGKYILVVEDNKINQSVIEAFILRLGARVDIAENGLQALDLWRLNQERYDLILMDCQMPVMDGLEATQLIRSEEMHMQQANPVPIVALTANVIEEDKKKCFAVGMNDFMAKPMNRDEFDDVVVKWAQSTQSRIL